MKNKRAEQIAAKRRHRDALKKKRREQVDLIRAIENRVEKPTILIVCEGQNTEPSYFRQFRIASAKIQAVGTGTNTIRLVKAAQELAEGRQYDQVWCVFDADPKPDNPTQLKNFDKAVELATQLNYGVGYSNQAFEYWLILHFEDHQGGAMPRTDYTAKLNSYLEPLGAKYDGNGTKHIDDKIFSLLDANDEKTSSSRVELAISRAKRNHKNFGARKPSACESSTTVYRLVRELLKYM